MLALADDFRTINWVGEYQFPGIVLAEIKRLPTLRNVLSFEQDSLLSKRKGDAYEIRADGTL